MKKVIKTSIIIGLIILLIVPMSLAGQNVPFFYNVLPSLENNSIIDRNNQKYLEFDLFEEEDNIYYNDEKIEIENKSFKIDISNLSGKQDILLKNDKNESVSFTYYISNENGLVEDYKFIDKKNIKTYVKTIGGIKVVYTSLEEKVMNKIEKYILEVPENIRENVKEIVLVPYTLKDNTAGVTKNNVITLYKISDYSAKNIEHIILHEIAHTWASKLISEKIIDYSYSDYSKAVKQDKKSVSSYSKKYADKEKYNEDFADSIAYYIVNSKNFENKYPSRADYIKEIINY